MFIYLLVYQSVVLQILTETEGICIKTLPMRINFTTINFYWSDAFPNKCPMYVVISLAEV